MTSERAIEILTSHLRECGALMPIEWVEKNGSGELMEAFMLAFEALRQTATPCLTLKVICGITGTACTDCKCGPCEARRMGVPSNG